MGLVNLEHENARAEIMWTSWAGWVLQIFSAMSISGLGICRCN